MNRQAGRRIGAVFLLTSIMATLEDFLNDGGNLIEGAENHHIVAGGVCVCLSVYLVS